MGTKYFINRFNVERREKKNLHDLANYYNIHTYARMNKREVKKKRNKELLFGSHKRSDHFKNQSIELQIFGYFIVD